MPAWVEPHWPAPTRVRALSTLRQGAGVSLPPFDRFNLGARCGDDPAAVAANRRELQRLAALPNPPLWLRQVHGAGVAYADALDAEAEPEADAAVTARPGRVLAVLTADCLPLLFCADDGSAVGVAHAGWRGLAGGVIEAAVRAFDAPPSRLLAWLGPAAGPERYEVGEEVRAAFLAQSEEAAGGFRPNRGGHWLCDLYALARQRLTALGVNRVFGGERCSIGEPEQFFSHRRDGRSGRMASLVWIEPA